MVVHILEFLQNQNTRLRLRRGVKRLLWRYVGGGKIIGLRQNAGLTLPFVARSDLMTVIESDDTNDEYLFGKHFWKSFEKLCNGVSIRIDSWSKKW